MKSSDVLILLAEHKNERGIANWLKLEPSSELESFGIGLTQLRKLAKTIGKNHDLALTLWNGNNYDAKVIGLLIDEPKKISREQAEQQVEQLEHGLLRHVFSSCDATLPKASFAFELANDWIKSKDTTRRSCGYGLIYEFSKKKTNKQFTDQYFIDCIKQIDQKIFNENSNVRLAMGGALMGIGKRNQMLNTAAIEVATKVGPIHFGDGHCDPFDVVKNLTSDYLKKKFEMSSK